MSNFFQVTTQQRRLVGGVGAVAALVTALAWSLIAPTGAEAAIVAPEGTYLNNSSALLMHGPWRASASTMALGGTFSTLNAAGSATLSFRSTGISWVTRTNAYSGIADVFVDGSRTKSVDLYSARTQYRRSVYAVTGLRLAPHTIRIVWTGRKNAHSQGRSIMIDGLVVLDRTPPGAPTGLTATVQRGGVRLDWQASPAPDVAAYRVYRQQGAAAAVLVQSVAAGPTQIVDAGLADSTTYRYRLVAVDTSGNVSPAAAATVTTAATPRYADRRYATCPTATVSVSNRTQLTAALGQASPGTVIALTPGRYFSQLDITARGTAAAPVWICGPRTAVLDGNRYSTGTGLRVDLSAHVVIAGLTVRNSQKGVAVMHSSDVTVADLRVENIGEEAIHLKNNTTDSTVIGNSIEHTGLLTPVYGEGVYIGTAKPNWCIYNGCAPDRSDRNTVVLNDISHTTAEQIEAKEAAVDGTIADNTLDGSGMVAASSDSLINIQSNGWVIRHNFGANAPLDGVQVWAGFAGYGEHNLVTGNQFRGSIPGFAVRLASRDLGNVVGCDTVAAARSQGISNKACQR